MLQNIPSRGDFCFQPHWGEQKTTFYVDIFISLPLEMCSLTLSVCCRSEPRLGLLALGFKGLFRQRWQGSLVSTAPPVSPVGGSPRVGLQGQNWPRSLHTLYVDPCHCLLWDTKVSCGFQVSSHATGNDLASVPSQ